jgi:hypothetical protein
MIRPTSENPYSDPLKEARDRDHLQRITDLIQRWIKGRNGQHEEISVEVQIGTDKETGRTLNIFIRAGVRN